MNDKTPLHIKHRPQKFEEMVGNDEILPSLVSIVRRDTGRQHSFLFFGPSGCGKTTLARIVAMELGCELEEIAEYNVANVRGIETIRAIVQDCRYAPLHGKTKVYLLDECHKLTNDAQNALLKLLEDTPEHVYFLLCTTDPEKVLKTIRTRCAPFPVKSLNNPQIAKLVRRVAQAEQVTVSKEIITKIASSSQGSPRQALVLLDQVIDIADEAQALLALENAVIGEATVLELCKCILAKNQNRWAEMTKILKTLDTTSEPEQIRYAVLGYLSAVLQNGGDDRVAKLMMMFFDSYMYTGKAGLIHSCYMASRV
jgi:DNA polymerase-3 subunit gamma/tau